MNLRIEIVVEKVNVKKSLQNPTEVHNPVVLVSFLRVGTVDPVQNVEETVGTHEEDVVPGKILDFSVTLQDN